MLEAAGLPVPEEMTGPSFLKPPRGEPYQGRRYVFAERGAYGSGLPTASNSFDLGRVIVSKRHKLICDALWQIPYTPVDFFVVPTLTLRILYVFLVLAHERRRAVSLPP